MANEAKTYWEKRCNINENVMLEMAKAFNVAMPTHVNDRISELMVNWGLAINELDREFTEEKSNG